MGLEEGTRSLSWKFEANRTRNHCVIIKQTKFVKKELHKERFHGNGLKTWINIKKHHTNKQIRG